MAFYNGVFNTLTQPSHFIEELIDENYFCYLASGRITIFDGQETLHLKKGDYYIARKNFQVRYSVESFNGEDFKVISLPFEKEFVMQFDLEFELEERPVCSGCALVKLDEHPLLKAFIQSLDTDESTLFLEDKVFMNLKRKELLFIILKMNPCMKKIFLNYADPGKIDIEAFMYRNFKFNINMDKLAFLSGRSLSTFKRDFEKKFNCTPGNWILQKRLEEAYFMISQKKIKPIDVYLEVGFEDYSHFSFAFKKMFNVNPSQVNNALV